MWVGILAEWQPLHLGHAHLIQSVKARWPDAGLLGVLSGPFDQRGQPMLWDKWARTKMALAQGVDLVIELPQYGATASMEGFARSGMEIMTACGVDAIAFGSESGDIAGLRAQAQALRHPSPALATDLKRRLASGQAYGLAVQETLEAAFPQAMPLRQRPNDRLNLLYLSFLAKDIESLAVRRRGEVSGTAIRQMVKRGEDPSPLLPVQSLPYMDDRADLDPEALYQGARLLALGLGPRGLQKLWGLKDGAEHRLDRAFKDSRDWASFLAEAADRHYSRARLARLLLQLLAPLAQKEPGPPPYLRVLGARPKGQKRIKSLHEGPIPVVVNPGRDQKALNGQAWAHFQGDLRRQNLWQGLHRGAQVLDRDFREPPVFWT